MSDSLQDLLQGLAGEGRRDSGGIFTLAAEKVSERYRTLLERNPELPWLRFLQYCYRVRARRYRCVMRLNECRLSLAGSLEVNEMVESLRRYPEIPDGDAGILHQVLWLFLAEQPQAQRLSVRLPDGQLRLDVRAEDFTLSQVSEKMEEDLELSVTWGSRWLGFFHEAARRAAVQRQLAQRIGIFPGLVDWDGGLQALPLHLGGRRRLVLANLVSRPQADRIPHFACPQWRASQLCMAATSVTQLATGETDCDWLVLHNSQAGDYELSGERLRVRLLFVYCVSIQPARLLPVLDGCLLEPHELVGWPPGITVLAACPPDLHTDLSGLKLVDDEALQGFLGHLRGRYAQQLLEVTCTFTDEFSIMGDLLAAQ